jgi:hypothetical protein
VAARAKAWICGRSFAGIVGSNPGGGMDVCFLMSVVCCQVEVSATGWSLVQVSATKCDVSESDREAPKMSRPWPAMAFEPLGKRQKV